MKVLESIRLVQFFLYDKEEFKVGDITGVFGANGSGKSALLDAVQIAMMGANARLVALNAQADEAASTRSLKAYCLGQYGETPEHRARDCATTYITLIWRDTETNEPVSAGVCLYAATDRETHEVLGRYVLRGIELSLGDHLEIVNGQERPSEWPTFRHQLVERSRATGEDPLFNDAERYTKALLLALRGSNGAPAYDAFTRAFRFGLRMRFDKSVDRIVREDVLEARPTNVRKFKEVTESFRRLAEMVAQVGKKIEDGEKIEAEFARATEESSRAASWTALAAAAVAEESIEKANHASSERLEAEERLLQITEERDAVAERVRSAREEAKRLRSLRESHSAHRDHGALQDGIRRETEKAAGKEREIRNLLGLVRRTLEQAGKDELLAGQWDAPSPVIVQLERMSGEPSLLSKEDLQAGLRPALKLAASGVNALFQVRSGIEHELQDAKAQLKAAEEARERISKGKAPLSQDVQRLLSELRDKGVQPRPVCDLVRLTDPAWQPVIEAYLGRRVEALMVSRVDESEAFGTYRSLAGQRAIYGAKLVLEDRQGPLRPPRPGSVAELIEGDDSAAVAYLRRQFGDIIRATTNTEALASGERTLTQDGMLASAGEVDRLRPFPKGDLKIGASGGGRLDEIQSEVVRLLGIIAELNRKNEAAKNLFNDLSRVADETGVTQFMLTAWNEMLAARQAADSLGRDLAATADEEYVRLGRDEEAKDVEASSLEPELGELQQKVGSATAMAGNKRKAEEAAQLAMERMVEQEKDARSQPEYGPDYASRQWDALLRKHGGHEGSLREIQQNCEASRRRAEGSRNAAVNAGVSAFGAFVANYQEQVSQELMSDWRRAQAWLAEILKNLRDTDIHKFRSEMDVAYRASQETFRSDVAIHLHSNIEWLDATMDRLNKVLMSCPAFTNGERYRFRRTVRPELEGLLSFIKKVAILGAQDDLLGGPGEIPEEFRRLLDEKTAPGAAGTRSALDDYREFFNFDIEILREDPTTGANKVVGHLSKRLGPGSGGEHRAPLYVIAGAALASAYRLSQGNSDGIRLIVLDEVFNKMDLGNIIATMRYLESLGMQVLMASPGENLGALTAFMDRYHEILRDTTSNAILIEGHSVSAETRAMFRDDLPEFRPDLVEQELAALRAQPIAAPALGAQPA